MAGGREDGSGAVPHVSVDGSPEGLNGSLHEVAAATAVAVQFNASGHHMHAVRVDCAVGALNDVAALGHFRDVSIGKHHRALVYPSLGGEYVSVVNLCEHLSSCICAIGLIQSFL